MIMVPVSPWAPGVFLTAPLTRGLHCHRSFEGSVLRNHRVRVARGQRPRQNGVVPPLPMPRESQVEARFLPVWFTCVASDWLQGPYLYSLFADRGFSSPLIAKLFAVGFISSAALGAVAGRLCDKIGTRRGCLLYCVVCGVSCLLVHSMSITVLILSRLLGGIADSLLHTAFEAWAIEEHKKWRSSNAELNQLLSRMWSGSWLVAIATGILGAAAVSAAPRRLDLDFNLVFGGPVAAFDLATLCCVVGAALLVLLRDAPEVRPGVGRLDRDDQWIEGSETGSLPVLSRSPGSGRLGRSGKAWKRTMEVILFGAIVAAFEGALFVFVFSWSPLLLSGWPGLDPHLGLVFSLFMLCCAGGSVCFKTLSERWSPSRLLFPILAVAFVSLFAAAYAAGVKYMPAVLVAFLFFELSVGMYFPCTSALKSDVVPDRKRALIYSLYRVPLNAFALGVLLGVPSQTSALALCGAVICMVAIWAVLMPSRLTQRMAD